MHKLVWLVVWAGCAVGEPPGAGALTTASTVGSPDPSGTGGTFVDGSKLDTKNPFFKPLGTNGRFCASCHQESQGWTVTPGGLQARFDATDGMDPIFRLNDGSTSPSADVSSTAARRIAYRMLLTKGLIRVGIGIPSNAEFTLAAVDDPYGHASASELSLFRRPLPSTNLRFLSTVMWDGRENTRPFDLTSSLTHQATDATLGHAQATFIDPSQMASIVSLETTLYTSQLTDSVAGMLDDDGPEAVSELPFYLGINDPLGGNPTGAPFDPNVFTLFDGWADESAPTARSQRRASIYRGQELFNTRPIAIKGVGGLNDALGQEVIMGTCTTCHDTPNIGNHSLAVPLNIGIADGSRRTADLPLYTLRNNATGELVTTTDPGRALITGKWADIGKFKGPILRGLSMRAPYFHNGSAATLDEVVEFYDDRFELNLSTSEKNDLVAFLSAL